MKKFLYSIVFIVIGVYAVDRVGGLVMWQVNQHTHDISGPKIKYLVNNVHEDVVLMGASRCNLHYVPSVIGDSIGMSVYNAGVDASDNIFAHYMVLNYILAHHRPKVICLEIMTNDYAVQDNSFNTVSLFAPYFGRNERADSVFREAGTYHLYQLSHLYRYNAKAISNIAGLLVNRQEGEDHGYIPSPCPRSFLTNPEPMHTPQQIDSLKLRYLQKFIDRCHSHDIRLVFVVSPAFRVADKDVYDVAKDVAAQNGIPFLDYHTAGLYLDRPELFKDDLHLWHQGACLYSSRFAHDLKAVLFYR